MSPRSWQRRNSSGLSCPFVLGFLLASLCAQLHAEDAPPTFRPNNALTQSGFQSFYNMDFGRAVADLEGAAGARPGGFDSQDPFALNNLANCYLVRELYRIGALDPADYLDDRFVKAPSRPAAADVIRIITAILDRAAAIEDSRLRTSQDDANVLYARGVTRALRASYAGLIEHSWFTALRLAMAARRDHQRVLELSPGFADADLIVGTHDYVMASLPWPVRTAGAVIGFHGNRQRGIAELRCAAANGGQSSVDARILLALFLRREGQLDNALQLVQELRLQFPGNVIFAMQEADILRATHRNADALFAYQRVWTAGQAGRFPTGGYQSVAVHMGDLQRSLHEDSDALSSYKLLEGDRNTPPELRQRALFAAGLIYDSQGNSNRACEKYRAVVAIDRSNGWAERARANLKCMRHPGHQGEASVAQGR